MNKIRALFLVFLQWWLLVPLSVSAAPPLSAIEWLQNVQPPIIADPVHPSSKIVDIENSEVIIPQVNGISVTPLNQITPDAVGLLPSYITGFPGDLWAHSPPERLASLIAETNVDNQPAMQALLLTLLLAETDPPKGFDPKMQVLLARIDKLIELGAIEPALALLERAGAQSPELFYRAFNLALLANKTVPACRKVLTEPSLQPSYEVRIFCHVRNGDWGLASFLLETASALGDISPRIAQLLNLFLNPDLAEEVLPPVPSVRPSPLEFRLFEAIGSPLQTASLPVAFAVADLSGNGGWKAQIDAAERLVQSGALSENQLLGIYTARLPTATGGIWDRVAGLQRFDQALTAGTPDEVNSALMEVWPHMQKAGLAVGFARMFSRALMDQPMSQTTGRAQFDITMLGPSYEAASRIRPQHSQEDRFLSALAEGRLAPGTAFNEASGAVLRGLTAEPVPQTLQEMLEQDRLGEVILHAIATYCDGIESDYQKISMALATLQAVNLQSTVRSAALQFLLLP